MGLDLPVVVFMWPLKTFAHFYNNFGNHVAAKIKTYLNLTLVGYAQTFQITQLKTNLTAHNMTGHLHNG